MTKHIALFFDGTWDRPHDGADPKRNTNVRKLYLAAERSVRQATHYVTGVCAYGGVVRVAARRLALDVAVAQLPKQAIRFKKPPV